MERGVMRMVTGVVLYALLAAAPALAARVALPGALVVPVSDPDGDYPVSWGPSPTPGVDYLLEEATNPTFTSGRRQLAAGAALSMAITGRLQDTTYYYRVRAVKAGETDSGWRVGNAGCAVPGAAQVIAPVSITVPARDLYGGHTVSWGASLSSGASYLLEEATNQTFTKERRVVYFGPALSKTITGRGPGVTYYYRVRALSPGLQDSGWRKEKTGCQVEPPPPPPAAAPLNDTGMTWYAADAENFLATAPPGFEGQDADHGRDRLAADGVLSKVGGGNGGFDFTKLDGNGNDLPASATSWSCVRDNHTGLVWEVKTNDGGLRDKDWIYSWYNSDSVINGGNVGGLDPVNRIWCGGDLAHCNSEAYVGAVNQAGLCGANDWRLPTLQELNSLFDYGGRFYYMMIDTDYFPNTESSQYWSSSPSADSTKAWAVWGGGETGSYRRYYAYYVRLVHGGQ